MKESLMTEEYKANWKEGTDYEKYVSRWIYEESVNLIHGYDSEEDQLGAQSDVETAGEDRLFTRTSMARLL